MTNNRRGRGRSRGHSHNRNDADRRSSQSQSTVGPNTQGLSYGGGSQVFIIHGGTHYHYHSASPVCNANPCDQMGQASQAATFPVQGTPTALQPDQNQNQTTAQPQESERLLQLSDGRGPQLRNAGPGSRSNASSRGGGESIIGHAQTPPSNQDSGARSGSKKRERSPDDTRPDESRSNVGTATKKQNTVPSRGCAVCGAKEHNAGDHPYPNTKWGYLLCCAVHNTMKHSTADCVVFRKMRPVERWMVAVERRSNKAPLYLGDETPGTIIATAKMSVEQLPDGAGPWSPVFASESVGAGRDIRALQFFQHQRETEGRGFHDLTTDEGRKALGDLQVWATTQFWDPSVKDAQYSYITWPKPTEEEIRSELSRLHTLAKQHTHHAPRPDWRMAPGLDMEKEAALSVMVINDEQEDSVPGPQPDPAETLPKEARQQVKDQVLKDANVPSVEMLHKNIHSEAPESFTRSQSTGQKATKAKRAKIIVDRPNLAIRSLLNGHTTIPDMTMGLHLKLNTGRASRKQACLRCGKVHGNTIDEENCTLFGCLCDDAPGHLAKDCTVPCKACLREGSDTGVVPLAMHCNEHCAMCGGRNLFGPTGHLACRLKIADETHRPGPEEKAKLREAQVTQCGVCGLRHLTQDCPEKTCIIRSCSKGATCNDHC